MPTTPCNNCHQPHAWSWTEAFDKFGFGDGDGQVMTEHVANVLRAAGYVVEVGPWGLHNVVIGSIRKDGTEMIPFATITFGYDDPRRYLPHAIVALLDAKLPDQGEVAA